MFDEVIVRCDDIIRRYHIEDIILYTILGYYINILINICIYTLYENTILYDDDILRLLY